MAWIEPAPAPGPQRGQRPADCKSTPSVQACCRDLCDAKPPSAPHRGTSIATVKPGAMSSLVRLPVDATALFVVNYRLPWLPSARCLCAGRGVAVVTCLQSSGPEPVRSPPWRWWPRCSPVVVHEPPTLPALVRWALLEARRGRRSPGRHWMPRSPIPSSREPTSFDAARSRACPHGLPARPRSHARPALDIRSGVDPPERMTLRNQD